MYKYVDQPYCLTTHFLLLCFRGAVSADPNIERRNTFFFFSLVYTYTENQKETDSVASKVQSGAICDFTF